MEMLLLAMVLGWVVKNGVKDLVHTGATAVCAVQGKPAPSWGSKRRMSRPNGAATRYFSQLWTDSWEDALAKHNERHARRNAAGPGDSGGAVRSFLRGNLRDGYRFTHRKWDAAWARLTMIRNLRRQRGTTHSRPGRDTVPGEVVPNVQDGDGDRPQDGPRPEDETEDRPRPEPQPVPEDEPSSQDEDERPTPASTGTCPRCGKTGVIDPSPGHPPNNVCPACWKEANGYPSDSDQEPPSCPKCGTSMTTSPNIGDPMGYDGKGIYRCPDCDYKIRRSTQIRDDIDHYSTPTIGDLAQKAERYFNQHPEERPLPTSTQEGSTMTATTTEVVGLDSAIRFCEDSARAYRAQIQAIEQTQAALAAGDVTGPAAETFAQAMEQSNLAAASMDSAAAELLRHKQVQEAYLANQGAGTRDFILAGQ